MHHNYHPPFFSVSGYVVWSTKLNLYLRRVDLQVYHSVQHGDSLFVIVDVVCLFVLVLPLMSALSPPHFFLYSLHSTDFSFSSIETGEPGVHRFSADLGITVVSGS